MYDLNQNEPFFYLPILLHNDSFCSFFVNNLS